MKSTRFTNPPHDVLIMKARSMEPPFPTQSPLQKHVRLHVQGAQLTTYTGARYRKSATVPRFHQHHCEKKQKRHSREIDRSEADTNDGQRFSTHVPAVHKFKRRPSLPLVGCNLHLLRPNQLPLSSAHSNSVPRHPNTHVKTVFIPTAGNAQRMKWDPKPFFFYFTPLNRNKLTLWLINPFTA